MTPWRPLLPAAIALSLLSFASCGGGGTDAPTPADSGPLDARADALDGPAADEGPEVDRGAPSDTYPAFAPGTPTLHNQGGYVMKAPEITTITYEGDVNADKLESFGDKLGTSAYWRATTEEYGIGPATSGPAHHLRLPGTAIPSFAVEGLVHDQLSDLATSKWPAPKEDSIYVVYLPTGSCIDGAGAFHNSVVVGEIRVPYAVVPACILTGLSELDSLTVVASHEISEASTDPQVGKNTAYGGFDPGFLAWSLWTGLKQGENADVCQFLSAANIVGPAELPFALQRTWSNKSAKAGKDPCAPVPDAPYFDVVALDLEDVTTSTTGGTIKGKGFHVPVGASRDITLGYFSSGVTTDWTLAVTTGNPVSKTLVEGGITATFVGSATGRNGNKATLRVTVDAVGVALPGAHLLTITSTAAGGLVNYYPLLITSN